eukprot:268973-Pyramimonas_sp.AAC.1
MCLCGRSATGAPSRSVGPVGRSSHESGSASVVERESHAIPRGAGAALRACATCAGAHARRDCRRRVRPALASLPRRR